MFTINETTAHRKAFVLSELHTAVRDSQLLQTRLPGLQKHLRMLARGSHSSAYPIPLEPILAEIHNQDIVSYRPLWLLKTSREIIIATPHEETTEIETEFPRILGPGIKVVNTEAAQTTLAEIRVYIGSKKTQNISPTELTIQQAIQLLSIGHNRLPLRVDLQFWRGELSGEFHYKDGSIRGGVHLCKNLKHGIRAPLGQRDFSRVKLAPDWFLYDTIFELDLSRLVQ